MISTAATPACPRCGALMPSAFVGRVCARCLFTSVLTQGGSSPEPARPSSEWKIGARVGDYDLVDILGRGGMAVVFLARQVSLDRLVALKTVGGVAGADAQAAERFRREARAVSRLEHPHIVSVHETGTLPGALFYTMEYIEGEDLGRALHERWFTARESASLLLKVTEAMAYAHSRGVIHRDLKPGNILLDTQGEPHVADFGLAVEPEQPGRLTLTGDFLGTPAYMPPERIDGRGRAEPSGDIYALGAILFQVLTGRVPFIGGSSHEILHAIVNGQIPSPRLLNPNVSRDLETICLKCLEREPAKRYATADALAEDLRRFLDGRPITARPLSAAGRFARWCRRKPAFAGVWFLLVALTLGSTLAAWRIRREQVRAEEAFTRTRAAEAQARERLRDAKIAEARAVRRTPIPGRRGQALAALAEATRIRPGADLRDEALAAMMIFDVQPAEKWDLGLNGPNSITLDSTGPTAVVEARNVVGFTREPARLFRWGGDRPFVSLSTSGARAIGPMRFGAAARLLMARFDDETLRLWRVGEEKPFLTVPHRPWPGGARRTEFFNGDYDFTPDGASFALGLPGQGLALYRVADGVETARWADGELFNLVVFSPDGRFLAATNLSDNKNRFVRLLSVPDLRLARTLTLPGDPAALAWSADSRVLAVEQSDGNISGYDLRDGNRLFKAAVSVHGMHIYFLGHDQLLAAQHATDVSILNVGLGREELELAGIGPSPVMATPQGDAFFVSSLENVVARVAVATPAGLRTLPPPRAAGNEVLGSNFTLDFSPDGRSVASTLRGILTVADVENGRLLADFDTGVVDSADTSSVAFSGDGRALYRCSTASVFTRYPLGTGADGALAIGPAEALDAEKGFVIADRSADRKRFALLNYESGAVKIVTVTGDGKLQTLGHWVTPGIYNAALSPDGSQLLTNCTNLGPDAAARRLRVYRVSDGSVLRELPGRVSCDTAWSADGRTAATSNGVSETTLWDTADWHVRTVLKGELGGDVTTFGLSPDSEYAVVTHDNRVHLVSVRDGALLASFACPGAVSLAASVHFLPDGKRFAVQWRNARIDIVDPPALRRGLGELGLDW